MALQLALITKVKTAGPDVFLISPKGLGDVSNRAVAVLFDMVQDLICKPLLGHWRSAQSDATAFVAACPEDNAGSF